MESPRTGGRSDFHCVAHTLVGLAWSFNPGGFQTRVPDASISLGETRIEDA